jgi:hypothetical protein
VVQHQDIIEVSPTSVLLVVNCCSHELVTAAGPAALMAAIERIYTDSGCADGQGKKSCRPSTYSV